jgi:toxin YoeB
MAQEVIWSPRAKKDLNEILKYWIEHNKSKTYSLKLRKLFDEAAQIIGDHPKMGKLTTDKTARYKIVRDYLLIYEAVDNKIHILTIWDGRQDPKKLKVR